MVQSTYTLLKKRHMFHPVATSPTKSYGFIKVSPFPAAQNPPPFFPSHVFLFTNLCLFSPFFRGKKNNKTPKVLVCNVQGIGDAISHKDNKTQDFQNANSPSHQNLGGVCVFLGRAPPKHMELPQSLQKRVLHSRKLTAGVPQNDGLDKVTPLKHGNFWYLC